MDFSSTKIQMISRVQYLPLVKQESFLRSKYETEELSVNEIASLTFSSRSTVVKYLTGIGIVLRQDDQIAGTLPFGHRRYKNKTISNEQEQLVIKKAQQLRIQGLSYDKIAKVMNTMGVRTKTGKAQWYAKTVRDILVRKK